MNTWLNRHLFAIILLLLVVSAVASVAAAKFRFDEEARLRTTLSRDAVGRRLEHFFSAMNDFPGSAGKDILFLHGLSSVQRLHDTESRVLSPDVRADFKNVLKNNTAYKDLFFLRKEFNCVMWVSNDERYDQDACETPPRSIADIIAKTAPLMLDEVYISPLMSYRDIVPDGADVPVIVYVTPANTDCSIISIVNMDYFLEEARRLTRAGESVFLLDKDGAYLANADRAKEKFFATPGNFYRDFPQVRSGALADASIRWISAEGKDFAFWRIYPTESNFAIYEGANKVMGAQHQDDYFWVMAAVSDRQDANAVRSGSPYVLAVVIIVIAHALVAAVAFVSRRESVDPRRW